MVRDPLSDRPDPPNRGTCQYDLLGEMSQSLLIPPTPCHHREPFCQSTHSHKFPEQCHYLWKQTLKHSSWCLFGSTRIEPCFPDSLNLERETHVCKWVFVLKARDLDKYNIHFLLLRNKWHYPRSAFKR